MPFLRAVLTSLLLIVNHAAWKRWDWHSNVQLLFLLLVNAAMNYLWVIVFWEVTVELYEIDLRHCNTTQINTKLSAKELKICIWQVTNKLTHFWHDFIHCWTLRICRSRTPCGKTEKEKKKRIGRSWLMGSPLLEHHIYKYK